MGFTMEVDLADGRKAVLVGNPRQYTIGVVGTRVKLAPCGCVWFHLRDTPELESLRASQAGYRADDGSEPDTETLAPGLLASRRCKYHADSADNK